ncbi:Uncharacterized protein SCG7109_BG_00030 [Chlamydiales bacterium SCGC AG-110-M15]|nr:Uncharacterized protein SCG7109_BG_00030 [Chlamydiales bacterium SCGC AG-110-M15]
MYRGAALEGLLDKAATAQRIPPLPLKGIPKQRLPGFIRWPLRALFLPFIVLDLFCKKVATKIVRPPFTYEGGCSRRGNCCHYILMEERSDFLGKLYFLWNTEINGFYRRQKETVESEGHHMVVMGCRYLQENGSCGNHKLRPVICREWPIIEHFGEPQILKGCGFKVIQRD